MIRSVLLKGCFFALGVMICAAAPVTVTVTKKAPITSLSASGDVAGVREATVGTHYTFVSVAGNQVTVQDSGGTYRLAVATTDYVPPSVATPAVPAVSQTNAVAQAAPPPSTTATPARDVSAPANNSSGTASPSSDGKLAAINTGFGKPVFTQDSFWHESALAVAQRLGLGLEGRTKWEASYRRYFSGDAADEKSALLGTGAYCVALYADGDDHPTSLLVAFINDGDYKNVDYLKSDIYRLAHPAPGAFLYYPGQTSDELSKKYDKIVASFEPDRKAEEALLIKNLSNLFGDPKNVMFGSDAVTRENSQRWDWKDVSFLLACQERKYNLLRVVPTAVADSNGRGERIPRDEIGKKLSDAVEHRPNGDVVITQIPMADQGPKGYCVPATWERVLRYTGVPGDMYTLSRIGDAQFGGGERGGAIAGQLDDTLHNYGRHSDFLDISIIDAISLHRYIDEGIPVFWSVNPAGYDPALQRYSLLDRDKDWDRWKTLLDQARAAAKGKREPLAQDGGHQVLITGYNPTTREIAWTDPWGRTTGERWMTMEEAQRCTLGQYYVINW